MDAAQGSRPDAAGRTGIAVMPQWYLRSDTSTISAVSSLSSQLPENKRYNGVDASSQVIRADKLVHRYPGMSTNALNGVDLAIRRDTVLGLVGPNGAGKSTLLSILSGVLAPFGGTVLVNGCDPVRNERLKSISALVPQEYAFYPDLSGRENLSFFAGIHNLSSARRRERVHRCAAVCQLEDVLARRAGTYSGGLKRRLNLAIGLLNEPRIVYLDEPTVGIDADSRRAIIEAIQALRRQGVTIVYASHYMEEVESLCDRVAVLNQGRIDACASLPELLSRLGTADLHVTLDHVPDDIESRLASWQPQWVGERAMHVSRIAQEDVSRLLSALSSLGVVVQQMRYGVGRLDDVYQQILSEGAFG